MELYKVLIVDDEKAARDRLGRMVLAHQSNYQIEFAANGLECLEKIDSFQPRIIFLDIQMPEMNGIEVIQQIDNLEQIKVIFQTAYDQFAIEAFEYSACDYLLKPFKQERLAKTLDKVHSQFAKNDQLDLLKNVYQLNQKYVSSLKVKVGSIYKIIPTEEIDYIKVENDYCSIYISSTCYLSDLSLSHLERILTPDRFLRCHRSYIVNLSKIDCIRGGSNMSLSLQDKSQVPVSRQNRNKIKDYFVKI